MSAFIQTFGKSLEVHKPANKNKTHLGNLREGDLNFPYQIFPIFFIAGD